MNSENQNLKIGWAQTDITPEQKVLVTGQFHARVSEGIENRLTATALALESAGEQAIFISCDLCMISDELRDSIRERVKELAPEIDPMKLIINATHTHTGPQVRVPSDNGEGVGSVGSGVDLDVMKVEDCVNFIAGRVGEVAAKAWDERQAGGGIAYGLGQAVVGRNRRWVNDKNVSTMYNLNDNPEFRHIEGYEDHSLNILATYDKDNNLTGVVVNVPCPSQVTEHLFVLSADYWHETRQELRVKLGENLFVLGQCSAAGDQAPRPLFEKEAHQRMLDLKKRTQRQELANRITRGTLEVLDTIKTEIDRAPVLYHHVTSLDLPRNELSPQDIEDAQNGAREWEEKYQQELKKLQDNPELRQQPRWYVDVSKAYRRKCWFEGAINRYKRQQAGETTKPAEVHVLRLGDISLSTMPFEYYQDFGIQIKVRSPSIQTLLVQLVGNGTYLPSPRSVAGGGYGSVPMSYMVGPQAGQILAEYIVKQIEKFWNKK